MEASGTGTPAHWRRAAGGAKAGAYILREQKHRRGQTYRSPSPILPEVLDALTEVPEGLRDLPDDAVLFRGTNGRHSRQPLGSQGIRNVIKQLFEEAGVSDAIPYDLRDSFAAWVGRSVRQQGDRVGEARDVARRLLGHGDGGDVLSRYYDDDERHIELAQYNP